MARSLNDRSISSLFLHVELSYCDARSSIQNKSLRLVCSEFLLSEAIVDELLFLLLRIPSDLSRGQIEPANRMASTPSRKALALLEQKETLSKVIEIRLRMLFLY